MGCLQIKSGLLVLMMLVGRMAVAAGEWRIVAIADPDTAALKRATAETARMAMRHDGESERIVIDAPRRGFIPCIYDMPYSVTANYPHYKELWQNTAVLFGAGFVTLGVLELLPENATAWNKAEIHKRPVFDRWWHNVKSGPVWDKDNPMFNYVLHPYGGAAYYMSARSQGFNMFYSFLYGLGVSTFFWEYGIEAFMEIPSWQDLIVTPMGGLILGEAFYLAKRHIVKNDYELLGTKWLGYPVAFLLDPVNECLGWFRGNHAHGYSSKPHEPEPIELTPTITPVRGGGVSYGFTLQYRF